MVCDGYKPIITRIFDPTKKEVTTSQPGWAKRGDEPQGYLSSISLPVPYHIKLFPDANPEQQRAFCYFQQNTAPTLAAFTDNTETFWLFHMPRFAVDDLAVFHCTVAVAARHIGSAWRVKDHPSLQEGDYLRDVELSSDSYSRAVRKLALHQSWALPELLIDRLHVILTCCALFIGYEAVADPTAASDVCLTHIVAGFRILQQVESNACALPKGEEAAMIFAMNRAMFGQLAIVFPLFTVPEKLMLPKHHTTKHQIIFPTSFHSTQEARASFNAICRCYWQSMASIARIGSSTQFGSSGSTAAVDTVNPAVSKTKARMIRWWELFTAYNRSLQDSPVSDAETNLERRKCQGYLTQFLIMSNALRAVTDPAAIQACGTVLACIDATETNKIAFTFRVTAAFPMNGLKEQTASPNIMSGDEWLWPSLQLVSMSRDEYIVNTTVAT